MKKTFGLIILTLIIFSSSCFAMSPPSTYEVWDRIPYEGLLKGKFTALSNIDTYSAPRSKNLLFYLSEGEVVNRVSCVVYANPAAHKVKVLRKTFVSSAPDVDADIILYEGDEVYLIMHTGEGTFMGWHEGKVLWWFDSGMNNFYGNQPIPVAWGEYLGEPTDSNLGVERWDCFQTSDGKICWVLVQKNGKELHKFKGEEMIF